MRSSSTSWTSRRGLSSSQFLNPRGRQTSPRVLVASTPHTGCRIRRRELRRQAHAPPVLNGNGRGPLPDTRPRGPHHVQAYRDTWHADSLNHLASLGRRPVNSSSARPYVTSKATQGVPFTVTPTKRCRARTLAANGAASSCRRGSLREQGSPPDFCVILFPNLEGSNYLERRRHPQCTPPHPPELTCASRR